MKEDYPEPHPATFKGIRDSMYLLRLRLAFDVQAEYERTNIRGFATGRFSEIFRPLFALTKIFGTKEELEILQAYVQGYESTMRVESVNITEEAELVEALQETVPPLYKEGEDPACEKWASIKALTDAVNARYAHDYRGKAISSILTRMGIDKRKKGTAGVQVLRRVQGWH